MGIPDYDLSYALRCPNSRNPRKREGKKKERKVTVGKKEGRGMPER